MTEITRNGHEYRIGQLDAFSQIHIVQHISPLIVPLVPVFQALDRESVGVDEVMEHLGPLATQLSTLDHDSVDYIIKTCLSVVSRKQGNDYYPVMRDGQPMYQDLTAPVMLRLSYDVIADQIGPFINGLLPAETGQAENESTPMTG